jgi:hypothetical protein
VISRIAARVNTDKMLLTLKLVMNLIVILKDIKKVPPVIAPGYTGNKGGLSSGPLTPRISGPIFPLLYPRLIHSKCQI